MRFIHLYLIGYFVLVVGAGLALWQAGVLAPRRGIWIAIGALIVVGLGIMLAVTSGKPPRSRENSAAGPRSTRPHSFASRHRCPSCPSWHELWFCCASHASALPVPCARSPSHVVRGLQGGRHDHGPQL